MALQTTGLEFFYLSVDFFENDKICMVDHTKFHKKYMSKIANIDDFDMIITDDKLESDIHVKNIIKAH